MTKIKNRYKIFKRYEEDLWGFLLFKKKVSKINKIIYLSQIDQFKKIDIRFLEVTSLAPKGKRSFFRTLIGKANAMTLRLRRYFVNLSQRQMKLMCVKNKYMENSQKRNFSFLIESRIDAILLRTNLFTSIRTIKQWIMHGFIFINLKTIWSANQHVHIGDIVSFPREKKILLYRNFFSLYFKNKDFRFRKFTQSVPLYRPFYLEQNYKLFFFYIWRAPLWSEIPFFKKFKVSHVTGPSKNRY